MGRGLDEVSGGRKIEPRARRAASASRRNRARLHPLRRWRRRVEARRSAHNATPIARARSAPSRDALVESIGEPSADSIASRVIAPGRSNWGRPRETGDDRRFEAMAAGPAVEDPVDPAVEIGEDMSGGRRAHRGPSDWRRARRGGRPPPR